MVLDSIICFALTILGGVFGMDKSHNFLDYIGPSLIAMGFIYALWCGFYILAIFIGAILFLKLVVR